MERLGPKNGNYGFISQDHRPHITMYAMPGFSINFSHGGILPAIGTRVAYEVKVDPHKAMPCAWNLRHIHDREPSRSEGTWYDKDWTMGCGGNEPLTAEERKKEATLFV